MPRDYAVARRKAAGTFALRRTGDDAMPPWCGTADPATAFRSRGNFTPFRRKTCQWKV